MTKRIWNWLNDLPDEYEHHDHDHAHDHAVQPAEVWDRRSSPTADRTMKMKRCLDARRTRQKDVHVIDLTGDQTDEDDDERTRKKARARLRTAERAGAVALFPGRKGTGRKRKRGAEVAVAVGATATRILEGDIVRGGALQSVC
ncbi:hypothetical protein LTR70_002339 [Exophiala xenobiotica]|uniref:Uncharacterized protein n=1 Tax=Lithohypha guttulata TaxID=1690604 RepID=A0ABR0KL11_9EURO|nr:hypothetical protein LTR24_001239 [Lithohypha guttulata]KAK5326074.1 hypothetical protein LTR70_002339 [Exophiala xenobiotica]